MITAAQCRAARALLGVTQDKLAARSGVSQKAIANFERGKTVPMRANLTVLKQTLELMGVEFLEGGGVRLK